jgi:5-methylcytosine-specific restriction endonuclease McrA
MNAVPDTRDRKEYFRKWHLENRDRRLAERKERYQNNREGELLKCAEWARNNRDKTRAASKKWQAKNKPYLAVRMGEYRKRHKHQRTTTPEERMRIRVWADLIKSKELVECHWCHKFFPPSEIEFDHIMPISKGGRHALENMCPACIHCNRSKGAKVILDYEI